MFARNPNKKYSFGSSPCHVEALVWPSAPHRVPTPTSIGVCVAISLPRSGSTLQRSAWCSPVPPGVDGPAPGPSASPSFTESEWYTAHGADAELACARSGARAEERLTLGCRGTSGRTWPVPRGSGGRRVRAAGGPGRVFGTRLPGRNGLWEETGALGP